ncbi:MAG: hypothetical protein IKR25_05835 [Muribaculaceae bacterium]|nr:hypothetical protein [Muribaculaceae bacterium]
MNTIKNFWLSAAMCAAAFTSLNANAQSYGPSMIEDKLYFQDLSIAPGEDMLVELWIDNTTFWWDNITAVFVLPEGLTLATLTEDDFSVDDYTFEACESHDGEQFIALSTSFGNAEYVRNGESWMETIQKQGYTRPIYYAACNSSGNTYGLLLLSYGFYCFGGAKPIVLLKLHADENLAEESEIRFTFNLFEGYSVENGWGMGQGENEKTQVNGTPTVARVRRVDTPAYNADVNGDGVVDIDDVNIVISTMLK